MFPAPVPAAERAGRRATEINPADPWAVHAVAQEVQGPIIAGLARCTRADIEAAARALKPAPRHRLHVFLATSAIHRQYKLNMAQDEIVRLAVEAVQIAREYCDDVEFSPEDASRTELEFLAQVVEAEPLDLGDPRLDGDPWVDIEDAVVLGDVGAPFVVVQAISRS